ncbi:uncharacterized protein LOC122869701 isoform X1 [Siniperca chuatsi]|uniref:uncharacterized protein LOC122869701 isoform X1 n=1 Tax=Siniperca chuatsi TaxID=119488 RepID=UPI001CE133EB|nr:uncharacterized protein LOC122869701 isoform X1 [Siniperca chuatsi]XP_044038872.1 uncharacterized protein LOC122869701 isoform X1 [Siniperca chuatsi]
MIWILLLAGLTSSICGAFVVKRTFYQAEEDDNITIRWDSRTKTDMSSTNLVCFLQSEPLKRLYELVNSVEVPESQHQQFAGRVQCDKDALREGRIRLHLSRVTTDDSGHYWCDLAANYDKIMRRWVLETTERFVLNVAQTNDGENSDTPKPELAPTKGAEHPSGSPEWKAPVSLVAVVFVALVWANWTHLAECVCGDQQRKHQDQDGCYIELPIEFENKEELFTK